MESLLHKKITTVIKNLIIIALFLFLAFEFDDLIIKLFLIPVSLWMLFIIFRTLLEKSINIQVDDTNQLIIEGILYDKDTYTYHVNEFVLGYRYIPFLVIEDKFQVSIFKGDECVLKFNASTFSKEDRDKLVNISHINGNIDIS